MDCKKNVILEYCAGAECESFVVRDKNGSVKVFSSADEFIAFLREDVAPVPQARG